MIEFSSLLKERRRKLLNEVFGIDARRVKPFSENDRGEDRSGRLRLDRRHIRNRSIIIYIQDFHCLNIGYGIENAEVCVQCGW